MIALTFRLVLLAGIALPGAAEAARSDWTAADRAQVRLLLAKSPDGSIAGGVEIVLEPGWHTYWRNPGESGVPPVFDFSQSENIADVEVLYPAPVRQTDGDSVSLVYRDEIVFPLNVTPRDPARPVTLRAAATFGVCSDVCIPTAAKAAVTLPRDAQPDPLTEARLAVFQPRVPQAPVPGRLEVVAVAAEEDALIIDVLMPESSYADLFADPPSGWYIGQPEFMERANGISRFRLSLAGRPHGAAVRGQIFRFVAVTGGAAIEQAIEVR